MDQQKEAPQLLLRIKRKRTEEPLDALLVQHQDLPDVKNDKRLRKNSLTNNSTLKVSAMALPRIFRLAETVEEDSFKNIKEAKKLKERISRRSFLGNQQNVNTEDIEAKRDKKTQTLQNNAKQARYRVINQNRSKSDKNIPPVVQSSSEKAAEDLFQMYEAVKDEKREPGPKLFVDDEEENPDDIMCNFIPMVKEYLTLNDRTEEEPEEDDYVYDVYYCDKSTDLTATGIAGPNVGSLVWFDQDTEYLNDDTDSEVGDIEDEDSNAEDFYQNDYPDEEDSDEDYEEQYGYEESSDIDYY
ncbi:uncharacterized protein BX664DRAFT_331121 [Halteromyces radiatus]|uniref:uncharacterized protein n=1 Tax=Halteromyces radiatus TaxID=101107 RepID=UPI00221EF3BC|nr:uncharacterized protein BX664DRAFT_331121 [Halteromyces radiatus]KAI8088686.1 hypothetical protein BX664DRAFT_331121 [Halteromyces radiatus]